MSWNLFHRVVSFLLIPIFFFYQFEVPAVQARPILTSIDFNFLQAPSFNFSNYAYTYDDVLDLLDEIEDGELEEAVDIPTLYRINYLIAVLAQNGLLPCDDAETLNRDIQELLYGDSSYNPLFWTISNSSNGEILLCKSWISKAWKKTKHFVKKHKKEILIGCAVVVAVVAVVGVVAAVSAAGAAGAAAGAASSDSENTHQPEITAPQSDPAREAQPQPEQVDLQTTLDEHVSSFKEMIVEDGLVSSIPSDGSIVERTRELGSFLAHETLQGVSELAAVVPQLVEEIREVGADIIPDQFLTPCEYNSPSPEGRFSELVAAGHKKIDQIFSTEQAELYSHEKNGGDKFTSGIIPVPGTLAGGGVSATGRIAASQATEVWGWRIGEDIRNRTVFGSVPKWSTVRRRHWKNQAHLHGEDYRPDDLERMRQGLAPQRLKDNGQLESKELHHIPSQRDGGLFDFIEVWPDEHALLDEWRHLGD